MEHFMIVVISVYMVTLSYSMVTINRVIGSDNFYNFYHGTDSFTNIKQQKSFCVEYNGECSDASCVSCSCIEDYIFLSYEHGCVTYDKAVSYLNGTTCLVYRNNSDFLPAVTQNTFQFDKCKKLYGSKFFGISVIYQRYNKCLYSGAEIYNSLYGIKRILSRSLNSTYDILWNEVNLNFSVNEKDGEKCLQGNSYDFTMLTGKIVKILISCEDVNQSRLNTCIMFKYAGNYKTDIELIQVAQSTQNSNSVSGIIVGVCLGCLFLLLLVFLFVFWQFRRRKIMSSVKKVEVTDKENDYQEIITHYNTIEDKSLKRKSVEEVNSYYAPQKSSEEVNPYYAQHKKVASAS